MSEEKPKRFPNTKAAFKKSMDKQIDGKTLIAMATYILYFAINKVIMVLYPSTVNIVWILFGDLVVGIIVWVICLLFNIDNPSVAKFFKQIGEFLFNVDLDDETAMKEIRIWYAALGQKYMKIFDRLGIKIGSGIIEIKPNEKSK